MKAALGIRRFWFTLVAVAFVSCSTPQTPLVDDGGGSIDTLPTPVDTVPPTRVTALQLVFDPSTGAAILEWDAPHDDSVTARVDRYEIRYGFTHGFVPPRFWELSTPLSDPPVPDDPGTRQRYVFTATEKGKDLYVGVRSYDRANNRSPNSDIVTTHITGYQFTGRCVDVLTGAPVEGLHAQLSSGVVFDHVTDANGEFQQTDVYPGALSALVAGTVAGNRYHVITQIFDVDSDIEQTFYMIRYQPTVNPSLGGASVLALLEYLTGTDTGDRIFATWHSHPVPVYAPEFVNGLGMDYGTAAREGAQLWMDRTGKPLFTFVSTPPDTGVIIHYRTRADMPGPLVAVTRATTGADKHPIRDDIDIVNDFNNQITLFKVMAHELGHTIRLGHLTYGWAMMYNGQPLPSDISEDEVNVVILHYSMPARVDMAIYATQAPPP